MYASVKFLLHLHPYLHNIFQFLKDITDCVSRNSNLLFVPRVFTNHVKRSFFLSRGYHVDNLSLNVSEAAILPFFQNFYLIIIVVL